MLRSTIEQLQYEVDNLNQQKEWMKNFVKNFQNNNETCIRLLNSVIENSILHPRRQLKIAIASIFESERNNPGKLRALYYNTPSPSPSVEQILLLSKPSPSSIIPYEQHGYTDEEDPISELLLDEAEQLFNRLVDAVTNSCVDRMYNDTESSAQPSRTPDIQNGLLTVENTSKIFDTRNLTEINLVYNDVTFQVYPYSEFEKLILYASIAFSQISLVIPSTEAHPSMNPSTGHA
jgi:hypothetical protein